MLHQKIEFNKYAVIRIFLFLWTRSTLANISTENDMEHTWEEIRWLLIFFKKRIC